MRTLWLGDMVGEYEQVCSRWSLRRDLAPTEAERVWGWSAGGPSKKTELMTRRPQPKIERLQTLAASSGRGLDDASAQRMR